MIDEKPPTTRPAHSPPPDVCLLLRSHAEARWLNRRVLPVLRELEQGAAPDDELAATTLAYLEAVWIEACGRAAETDGARVELDTPGAGGDGSLREKARRYHAAVRRLRAAFARRVESLVAVPHDLSARDHAGS